MNVLGTPSEYEVFIVDSLTQTTVDVVEWSQIQWQKTQGNTSTATVTCARQPGFRQKWHDISPPKSWGNMLVIQRDGARVWDGPVMGWSSNDNLVIEAADRAAALEKRLVVSDIDLTDKLTDHFLNTDLLDPMITASGLLTSGIGQMPYSMVLKNYVHTWAQVEGAWRFRSLLTLRSVFDELAGGSYLSWTQDRENLWLFIENASLAVSNITLRPEYIISPTGDIGVTIRGRDMATGVYKGDTGQGVGGFPNPALGTDNQTYVPYGLYGTLSDAGAGPGVWVIPPSTPVDPRQFVNPAPVPTLEQVTLSSDFPCDANMTALFPGCLVELDFPNSWSLNTPIVTSAPDLNSVLALEVTYASRIQYARLDQVDVSVTRNDKTVNETVRVSLTARASL